MQKNSVREPEVKIEVKTEVKSEVKVVNGNEKKKAPQEGKKKKKAPQEGKKAEPQEGKQKKERRVQQSPRNGGSEQCPWRQHQWLSTSRQRQPYPTWRRCNSNSNTGGS